jgi:hypothetical protein
LNSFAAIENSLITTASCDNLPVKVNKLFSQIL